MVPTDIRYDGAMSELGQSRRFCDVGVESGSPPEWTLSYAID